MLFLTSHDSVTSQKEADKNIFSHNILRSFVIQISPLNILIIFFPITLMVMNDDKHHYDIHVFNA